MSASTQASPAPAPSPAAQVMQLATGYWVSRAVYFAARWKLADLVAAGPKTAEQLAEITGTNPDALYRMLRALASVGMFAETESGTFEPTPLSEALRSGAPESAHGMVLFVGDAMHWSVFGGMEHSLRTGRPAFDHVFGQAPFEWLKEHPEEARTFDEAMASYTSQEEEAVLSAYDFSRFSHVVDIAGGSGALLGAILRANPKARGTLFDLGHVIERARGAGLTDATRTNFVAGSFFENVPSGGDAYILKHIVHDWPDAEALRILSACRRAMRPESLLLVIEVAIPPGNQPSYGKLLDLEMMLIPGGRERTAEQYGNLFAKAGLRLERIVPTASNVSVIEASPAW